MRPESAAAAYAAANLEPAPTAVKWWGSSCGRIELAIALDDARSGSHQGRCDDDIAELRKVPYIAEQLADVDPKVLAADLKEYGAWDDSELADHDLNLSRLLWLACGSIVEESA